MPNVPQAVPVEKERNAATTNTMAGRMAIGTLDELTTSDTYGPTLSASHTPFSVHASVRMVHAGTIDLNPAVRPSIKSRKVRMRRGKNSSAATIMAPNPPIASERFAFVLPKASNRPIPPAK